MEGAMDKTAAEEFTQTVEQHLGASWRQMAWALQQGVPEALGLTDEEWGKRISGRVRLDVEERRKAALELYHQDKMTVREIGVALGVGRSTVSRDLHPVVPNETKPEEIPQVTSVKAEKLVPDGTKSLTTAELLEQLKARQIDVPAILKSQEAASAEAAALKARLEAAVKPEPVQLTREQMLDALRADGVNVDSIEAARKAAQDKLQAAQEQLRQLQARIKDPEQAKAVLKKAGIDVWALQKSVEILQKPPADLSGVQVSQSPEMTEAKAAQTVIVLAQDLSALSEKLEDRYRHLQPLPDSSRPHGGLAQAAARLVAIGERFSKYATSGFPDDREFWDQI